MIGEIWNVIKDAFGFLSGANEEKARQAVMKPFLDALHSTQHYLANARQTLAERPNAMADRDKELELVKLWTEASAAMYTYNKDLSMRLRHKAQAWADPKEWDRVKLLNERAHIEQVIMEAERLFGA